VKAVYISGSSTAAIAIAGLVTEEGSRLVVLGVVPDAAGLEAHDLPDSMGIACVDVGVAIAA
jgi:hypothetical protein